MFRKKKDCKFPEKVPYTKENPSKKTDKSVKRSPNPSCNDVPSLYDYDQGSVINGSLLLFNLYNMALRFYLLITQQRSSQVRPLELNGEIAGYSVMNIELKRISIQFVARKFGGKSFK